MLQQRRKGPRYKKWFTQIHSTVRLWDQELIRVIRSDQISRSVVSDYLRPHELQHARPPCPSPTPGAHPDPRPSSRWCHPAISSSVVPFSSCPQSLPASESFPMSRLFAWAGQSTGVSALASVLPKKSQGWSPSEWTGWISLQSKGLSRVFANTTVQKHQILHRMTEIAISCTRSHSMITILYLYYLPHLVSSSSINVICCVLWLIYKSLPCTLYSLT